MSLQQISMAQNMVWVLQGTAAAGFNASQQGSDGVEANLGGVSVTSYNQLFAQQYSILHGTSQTFNLASFTNLVNDAVVGTKLLAMIIKVSGTGASVTFGGAASNGLVSPFSDISDKLVLGDGASFSYSCGASGTPFTIDGTHHSYTLTNTAGAGTAVVTVAMIVSTL